MEERFYIIKHKTQNIFIGIDSNSGGQPYKTTINNAATFSSKQKADDYFSDEDYTVAILTYTVIY